MKPLAAPLSSKDASILDQIFDPESTPTPAIEISADAPPDPHITDRDLLSSLKAREIAAIKLLETHQAQSLTDQPSGHADNKIFDLVYSQLSSIASTQPSYASVYNNRAQFLRLRYGDHLLVVRSAATDEALCSAAEKVLADVNTAIRLSTPPSPSAALSQSQAQVLAQAHSQRAALLYTASKDAAGFSMMNQKWQATLEQFDGWDAERFEEAASRDFFLGGRYGNEVSEAMAVHTNPHAKLCGAMVQEAMKKEYAPAFKETERQSGYGGSIE